MDGVGIDYSGNQKKHSKTLEFRVIQSMNYCRNNAFLARGGLPTGFFFIDFKILSSNWYFSIF